jgi:hypothetical protein
MKKNYLFKAAVSLAMFFGIQNISAQCNNGSQFGSAVAPAMGSNVVITTCHYAGEFAPITSVAAGATYSCTSSVGTDYITIRQGTSGGAVIAFGPTPLTWTATVAGTYYLHVNSNSTCGTISACRTTAIGRPLPPSCTNNSAFGSGTAPSPGNVITITTCNYATEYATVSGVVAGNTYSSSSSIGTDYITVRSGTFNGPLVAAGTSPLIWTAVASGNHYIHINTNSTCGTNTACRSNILRNISPAPPVNDNCANATALAAVSTVTGTTFNATLESPTPPSCATTLNQPGVWYTVTGTGNKMGASLCGTPGWDSKMFVYTGACGALTCLTSNDDFGPLCASAAASTTWCSVPGTVYRILVTGYSSTSSFTLATSQTVIASPTITASSPSICSGNSATLSATGSTTFTWNPGALTGSAQTVAPGTTTSYTVSGVDLTTGCNNFANYNLVVNATPTISVNSATNCTGYVYTITPTGASTYTISGGSNTVSPTSDTNYTITGTSAAGCPASNTAVCTVSVLITPTITVNSGTLCQGTSFTLVPAGASTYTITGGNSVVYPITSTSYSVVGTETNGCVSLNTAVADLTVFAQPTVAITPTLSTICAMSQLTLTSSGAVTYTWSTAGTGSTAVVSATAPTQFSVVGADALGCTTAAFAIVLTNTLPIISVSPSSQTVCSTGSASFTASGGASSYTWNTGATTNTLAVNPSVTTVYTVTGTDANNGCLGTQTVSVKANPLPVVIITPTSNAICIGAGASFTASGATSYLWNDGSFSNVLVLTPTVSGSYTVTGTDSLGCVSQKTVSLVVNPLPTVAVTPVTSTICAGEVATFNASGAASYTWLPGNTNATSYTASPVVSSFYTLTGTDANNCSNKLTFILTVNACTGIDQHSADNGFVSLYPNPTNGQFTVKFEMEGEKTVVLYNSVGQVISSSSTSDSSKDFNLSGFAKGIYFVNVKTQNHSGNYKLIIE